MNHRGFSHVGLSTLDLDKTRKFYEDVLGFKPVVADTIKIEEGGRIRHIFFDVGRDQLIAFIEADGVRDVPAEYDTGINHGLGVPASFYHFAFEAGSEAARLGGLPCSRALARMPYSRTVANRGFQLVLIGLAPQVGAGAQRNDRHPVLGERAGLVGTEHPRGAEGLRRSYAAGEHVSALDAPGPQAADIVRCAGL